ncbi:hypothetical protein DD888_11455, partial [Staphylococcus pseudintermedius]|uniref:hypothetical protein n=1 Tax=Staphylococcus pseudintermedius TaxID=283734 RepID=UPI000DA0D158
SKKLMTLDVKKSVDKFRFLKTYLKLSAIPSVNFMLLLTAFAGLKRNIKIRIKPTNSVKLFNSAKVLMWTRVTKYPATIGTVIIVAD